MIKDREYNPAADELTYHYCGADAFAQIVRSQTMWHTAYSGLNDVTEREWGLERFEEVADELRKTCGAEFIEKITSIVSQSQKLSVAMISSYSLDGDVLSQWRAYADDGRGFAIGFSAHQLEMPARPLRVLYDRAAQRAEIANNVRHVFQVEKGFGFRYDAEFFKHWFNFGLDLCAYKHPGFAEEQEIRRVHISGLALDKNQKRMIPLGAVDGDGKRRSEPVPIKYRVRNGVQIPYVSLDITDGGKNSPIKEVVLGPRNPDTEENVDLFLRSTVCNNVKLLRSQVPYR